MKMTMTIKTVLAMMMTMMVKMTITSFTTMVRIVVRNNDNNIIYNNGENCCQEYWLRQLKEMVAATNNKTCILYFDKILPKIT